MDADTLEKTPNTGSTQISKEIANPATWPIGVEKVLSSYGFVTVKSDFLSCSTVKEDKSRGELGYLSCSTVKEDKSSGNLGYLSRSTVKEDKSSGNLGYLSRSTVKEDKSSGKLGYLSRSTVNEDKSSGKVGFMSCSTVKEDKSSGELGYLSPDTDSVGPWSLVRKKSMPQYQIALSTEALSVASQTPHRRRVKGNLPAHLVSRACAGCSGSLRDYSDGCSLDHSTMSQRNSQAAHPALEPEELKGWTANLIQYLVSQSSSKHPVKRSDITKDLGRLNSKDFEVVLKAAKKAMAEAVGLHICNNCINMRKVEFRGSVLTFARKKNSKPFRKENHPRYTTGIRNPSIPVIRSLIFCENDPLDDAATEEGISVVLGLKLVALDQGNSKVYILLSSCGPQSLDAVSREERKHVVLLMIVLSFILMSGGVCRETHIWKALQEMNIVKAEKKVLHPYFGDVYRLVTQDYVRQLYLEYTKVVAVDPPIHDFRWGKRAELEVSQKAVVEYACEVLHRKPGDFRSIYNEAIRKEQNKGKRQSCDSNHYRHLVTFIKLIPWFHNSPVACVGNVDGASTSQQTQALTGVSSSQGSSSQRLLRM
uniref:MAGE domain-containing protein n=1 Tax=Timema tahoe TaxID=61484 RepID=A0A7R9IE89_9NEOP|nr:unnamed protein product [Timema tahoe]